MAEEVIERKKKGSGARKENRRHFDQSRLSHFRSFFQQQQKDAAESSGRIPCSSRDSTPLWAELEASTQHSDVQTPGTRAARQKK